MRQDYTGRRLGTHLLRPFAAMLLMLAGANISTAYAQTEQAEGSADPNALEALSDAIANYKTNLEAIKEALQQAPKPTELTTELTTARGVIDDLTVQLDNVRSERDQLSVDLSNLHAGSETTIAALRDELDRRGGAVAQLQSELQSTQQVLGETESLCAPLASDLAQPQSQLCSIIGLLPMKQLTQR